jgi:hypothetical protein
VVVLPHQSKMILMIVLDLQSKQMRFWQISPQAYTQVLISLFCASLPRGLEMQGWSGLYSLL